MSGESAGGIWAGRKNRGERGREGDEKAGLELGGPKKSSRKKNGNGIVGGGGPAPTDSLF